MPETVILSTARTPVGKLGGALSSLDATELGGTAIAAALERAGVEPEQVEHVIMGQVLQAGQGQIPSRQAQIKGGIPKEVSSETINKVCASGLRSTLLLDQAIRAGDVEIGLGGGMESMSYSPYMLPKARFGFRMGDAKAIDAMIQDGLRNPFTGKQMFEEASDVAAELELTRPDMDRWALRSHQRAVEATDDGRLPEEIVPVTVKSKKGEDVVEVDEAPRRETSLEVLAKLPPLNPDGSHTAGNSPGVNDGAGAVVVASDEWASAHDAKPLAAHHRPRPGRGRLPLPGPHAGGRVQEGAREGRAVGRRHRPVGDQRGLRLGHAELDPRSRHRRGQGQRQRWARWPSATRSAPRGPGSSARSCRSCTAAAAARASWPSARAAVRATPSSWRSSATAADAPPLRSPR